MICYSMRQFDPEPTEPPSFRNQSQMPCKMAQGVPRHAPDHVLSVTPQPLSTTTNPHHSSTFTVAVLPNQNDAFLPSLPKPPRILMVGIYA
jgi:hypothetical protein